MTMAPPPHNTCLGHGTAHLDCQNYSIYSPHRHGWSSRPGALRGALEAAGALRAGVRSDAAELSWLRRHAMELEMARQEALVRRTKAATEGQSNGVGGTRRRNNPNNNHKQGEAERKILAQVRELYHERASSELASRSE